MEVATHIKGRAASQIVKFSTHLDVFSYQSQTSRHCCLSFASSIFIPHQLIVTQMAGYFPPPQDYTDWVGTSQEEADHFLPNNFHLPCSSTPSDADFSGPRISYPESYYQTSSTFPFVGT